MATLTEIITLCKSETDNVNSTFITDSEWTSWINNSYRELYGLITQAFGNDYFVQTPSTGYTFTTDGANSFFSLPADFFKLLGVDLLVSSPGVYVSLKPFDFVDRNRFGQFNSSIPQAGQTIRVFYVPRVTALSAGSDVVDGVNGWEEYIVADCGIKAKDKAEEDASIMAMRKQALLDRIQNEAARRDAGSPATVADTQRQGRPSMAYRLNGSKLWLIGNGQSGYPWGGWGYGEGWWF